MTNPQEQNNGQPPERRTFAKAMTQKSFIHIQDALSIGKLSLWIGQYSQGEGCSNHATAYLDVDAAMVIFQDILLRGGFPASLYPNQKIEFYGGSEKDGQITARVLRFSEDTSKNNPIVIEIATGPGTKNQAGGFQPKGKLDRIPIFLDRFTARKMAATVLSKLRAISIVRQLTRKTKQNH